MIMRGLLILAIVYPSHGLAPNNGASRPTSFLMRTRRLAAPQLEISAQDRLKAEAADPFRTLRLFVYGASGASASIGLLTSAAQLAGALNNAPAALPLDQVVQNVGVNFAVVAAAIVLYKFESDGQQEKIRQIASKGATSSIPRLTKDDMVQREITMTALNVEVIVDAEGWIYCNETFISFVVRWVK